MPKAKNDVFLNSPKVQGADTSIVQYLGIAADEPERIERHSRPGIILPLVELDGMKPIAANGVKKMTFSPLSIRTLQEVVVGFAIINR